MTKHTEERTGTHERDCTNRETHACDCISRQAALEVLDEYTEDIENGNWGTAYSKARTSMCDLPSVEPEKCGDCVSREWLYNECLKIQCDKKERYFDIDDVRKLIVKAPSVEPEIKVGKWISISRDDDMEEFYCCSLCKREIILYPGETLKDYPYCHCGAKMEGGVNCNAEY